MLGGSPDEYLGHTFASRASRDDEQKLSEMFQNVISANYSSAHVEVRVRHQDGSWKTLTKPAPALFTMKVEK